MFFLQFSVIVLFLCIQVFSIDFIFWISCVRTSRRNAVWGKYLLGGDMKKMLFTGTFLFF